MPGRIASLLRAFHEKLFKYAWKFGLIGGIAFGIDVGVFNALRATLFDPATVANGSLWANVGSTIVATLFTWFGNRYWAFREHRRKNFWLELAEFVIVSLLGLGITTLCLHISHNVLGLTSPLADNISKNVVGLILGTAFRFLMYRFLVFSPKRKDGHSRLRREAEKRAFDEAALVAAIDPGAAGFLEDAANDVVADGDADGGGETGSENPLAPQQARAD
ncbi:MAG: GtrA family protein [Microbacteriaceae bacterium]|nr:GtrA family protein [Microbacteriaceae bacterium]